MDNKELQFPELPIQKPTVDDLKKRIGLQKKKNAIRKELNERGILPKGAHNDYDNYDYFTEAQYKELFTELFSKHGVELIIDEADYGTFDGTDKQPFGRVVTLACTLIDIDTGYSETSKHTGEGLDRGDKAGYKATTGAIKKFLSSTFLVATKDDPEREDEKPAYKSTKTSKTTTKSNTSSSKKLTPKQRELIVNMFSNDVDQLKKILKDEYSVKKVDELSIDSASKLIETYKENR